MLSFNFSKGLTTPFADGEVARVFADVERVIPAALALFALGGIDRCVYPCRRRRAVPTFRFIEHFNLRDYEQGRQMGTISFQQLHQLRRTTNPYFCF